MPLTADPLFGASIGSSPVENNDALVAPFGGCVIPPVVGSGGRRLSAGGTFFFVAFLLATDKGLNIVDFFFGSVSSSGVGLSGLLSVDEGAASGPELSTTDPP